jgi:hypothetical protein
MAKNFDRAVGRNHFSGAGRLHDSAERDASLVRLVRAQSQWIARDAVVAASITAITDNSGGTAGVVYKSGDSGEFATNDLTGLTTGVQSSAFNTAADLVMNALREVLDDAGLVLDGELNVGTVDEGPGGAPNNTIEVLTVDVTANTGNTDAATFATANAARRDINHAVRMTMHVVDDAREAVGLARIHPTDSLGRFAVGSSETLVFADADPDTITRDVGSWAADGFLEGDEIEVSGTDDNNGTFTIDSMSATVLTLVASDALTAESLSAAETLVATVKVTKRAVWPGRLGGPDTLDIDGTVTAAGSDWTLEFETGTSAISDAVDGSDATAAVLKTEVDAWFAELADNIAFLADNIDAVTGVAQTTPDFAAISS